MKTDEARSYEQLTRLQAISDAALEHVELDALLDVVLTRLREILDADTAAVLLLSDDGGELVARAAKGLEEEVERGVRIPVGAGFAGRIVADRRPIVIDRLADAQVVNPILREKGIESMLGVPLTAPSGVIGVVHVGTLSPRTFTSGDVELLELAADRVGRAIEHASLYEAERTAHLRAEADAARLLRLQEVTDVALLHASLDDLLPALLGRIRQILGADTCAILLLDEERDELVARAAVGIEEEVEAGVRIPVGRGFAGLIAAERRPVAIDDVDHADILNPILREKGIKSLLGAPLGVGDRILGIVHVGTLTKRVFTEADAELLELAAARAALGIENARLIEDLRRLDQLKSNFVSFAAHELRGPAAAIRGISETIRSRGPALDEAQMRTMLAALHDQSDRLASLIEQLLDLSRLEAETLPIERGLVPVGEVLASIVEALPAQDRPHVSLELRDDVEWELDAHVVERIVGNLLANALRHGAPPVTVSAAHVNSHLEIAVEDAGAGVPADLLPRLFERFERGRRATSGHGLGLAIARAYARAHGGDLRYEACAPRGSRFTFVVPGLH